MEIQIMTPSPAVSTNTTPYATAPSSPHRFPNFFYSAPTSPIHALVGFQQHEDSDFAFNFQQPPSISAADELFDGGIIKPLDPVSHHPPRCNNKNFDSSTEPFTQTPGDQDSFTQAFTQTPGDQDSFTQTPGDETQNPHKRGRKTTRTRDKLSRSSSPFRISDILSDEENNDKNSPNWYSKWNLKNLILFRSVSEGSVRRSKEPVNKYSRMTKCDEDVKSSSFRSAGSCRSGVGTRKVSAHEIHYTANRAVAEEMRRKTYLPYKSGFFGCLGFHNNGAGGVHQISRGITSVMKQR